MKVFLAAVASYSLGTWREKVRVALEIGGQMLIDRWKVVIRQPIRIVVIVWLPRNNNKETHLEHHSLQVAHSLTLSVRSATTSFSATIYSYRDVKTSRILSGTVVIDI